MKCPQCEGAREIIRLLCIPCSEDATIPCPDCDGTGIVSDEHPQWLIEGQALKQRRIAAKITARKLAKVLGIDASDLSKMQRGFKKIPWL